MSHALQLARRGQYSCHPNPRVGCVITQGEQVVGSGWHAVTGGPHAEIEALRLAAGHARGATAYVTLEPCAHQGRTPPCTDALISAGLKRVVAAMEDPNPRVAGQGLAALRAAGLAVECGLLGEDAAALNAGFVSRMTRGRPRTVLKLAASLDGRTAMASGESQWITGPAARADVQRLRAASSAVLTGVGTVISDDPSLTVRDTALDTGGRQPLRVIVDSRLRTPPDARMLRLSGQTLIAGATGDSAAREVLERAGARVERFADHQGKVDLARLLARLGELECNDVLVETGARLAGVMVGAGLIDELVLYLAPHLMGTEARGLVELTGLSSMADRVQLTMTDVRQIGPDLRIRARFDRKEG
jgi:diaminohydroxyphosphoribosylaminopyrimidine deaminase/5-amino-6-(5-phosphoribosylamino)uracil reductase